MRLLLKNWIKIVLTKMISLINELDKDCSYKNDKFDKQNVTSAYEN